MQSNSGLFRVLATLVATAVLAGTPARAGVEHFDHVSFMNDAIRQSSDPERLTMVMWFPNIFWEWSFSQDAAVSEEMRAEFMSVVEPYVMVGVVDGTIGPFGGPTFTEGSELRKTVKLIDSKGKHYDPLEADAISSDAANFTAMMKPMLANMIGPMGANMEFFYFPARTGQGLPIARADKEGNFSITVADEAYEWRTPLGSVLPFRYCPKDNEQMSGAWSFCPWHGKKLVSKPGKKK